MKKKIVTLIIWSLAICLFVVFSREHKKEKTNLKTYSTTHQVEEIAYHFAPSHEVNPPKTFETPPIGNTTSSISKPNEPRLVKSDFVDSDDDGLKDTYIIIGIKPSAEDQPKEIERNPLSNSERYKTYKDYGSGDYVPPDIVSTIIHVNSEESDYILKKLPGIGVERVMLLKARRPFYSVEEVMAAKIGIGPKYGSLWREGFRRGTIVFD